MKVHVHQQLLTADGMAPLLTDLKRRAAQASNALAIFAMMVLGTLPSLAAPPPNDDINNAVIVTEPLPFTHSLSTVEATTGSGDPDCVGNGPTVWYAYTPSADGYIKVDTVGSDYDTTLSAYTGLPGSLTQIACNDDGYDIWPQSRFVIPVTAGETYRFMVGSFASGPGGNLVFNVQSSAPVPVVNITVTEPISVAPVTGTATVRVHVEASSPVFLFAVGGFLVQPTGRGNVVAFNSEWIADSITAHDSVLLLKDETSLRSRGTGFTAGPARLIVDGSYLDDSGFNYFRLDQEVVLRGSGSRP